MANPTTTRDEEQRITPPATGENDRLQPSNPAVSKDKPEDYLRQYQYRKQTIPGSPQSDPAPGSKAAKMKKFLLSQPKAWVFIPADGKERQVKHSVTLNGYRLDLPRNQGLEVPKQVADVLNESFNQTEKALATSLIAGNTARETALS